MNGGGMTGAAPARRNARAALLLPVWGLFSREVRRFLRQRNRVVGSLGTPLVFWVLLGSGFGSMLRPPGLAEGLDYLTYFFPGTVMLVVLFTAIFASISVIQDRTEGFLQCVLAAPVPRLAIVLGKVSGGAALGFAQGLLMLSLAPLAGLSLGVGDFLAAALAILLTALALSALGFLAAWRMDSVQGFHAVMTLLLIPMWLMSGALFPAAGASPWVRAVMAVNPLAYGLTALRGALHPAPEQALPGLTDPLTATAVVGVFALVALALSAWIVSRPERG